MAGERTPGLASRASTLVAKALEEARRLGYEQARADAERQLYAGEDALFAWVAQRATANEVAAKRGGTKHGE